MSLIVFTMFTIPITIPSSPRSLLSIGVLKSRAEAAEAAHAVTAAELSALQSTTRDQQQLVASLQATVTSLQATIAEQKAQLLAAKESSVQAVARKEALAAAARKVASLESDLATSTAQLKDAQESLEKEKKKSKEAKKKADADAEKLANDYAVAKTRLSQLEEEKAKLSEQLRDALTKDSSLASSAETALQGLRQELDNVRAQSVAAERRHEETVRTMQTGREAAEARVGIDDTVTHGIPIVVSNQDILEAFWVTFARIVHSSYFF